MQITERLPQRPADHHDHQPRRADQPSVTDASGQVMRATDGGGTLDYAYNSQGNLLSVTKDGASLTSSVFDAYGRQTSLTDQNAGTTAYAYNALGQLTSQTNANGQTTTLLYDQLGRNTTRQGPEGNTVYEYYGAGNGSSVGLLRKITSFAGNLEEYFYDDYGQLTSRKETVEGTAYQVNYTYNLYGDMTGKDYLISGFGTRHAYDANGYPTTIKSSDNAVTLYTNNGISGQGVNTSYTLGNGVTSTVSHYYGVPTKYATSNPAIQNLEMTWHYASGNLLKRKDLSDGGNIREENFGYDVLNRLTSATVVGQAAQTVNYGNIGNINFKSDLGTYTYPANRPNAVTTVNNPAGVVPNQAQTLTYTPFAQPATVTEDIYQLTYTYGSDYNRIKSVTTQSGTTTDIRYYFGDYEKINNNGTTVYTHYIGSPAGLVAIVVRVGSANSYYYTYTDHLGSILRLTRTDQSIVTTAEQSFDAWGRRRNPTTWVPLAPTTNPALPFWLIRGYTGHEQLDQFGLINMNGRLYDPALGRVLSPDNYVQDPFGTQSYNRYTYAFNNPLVYSDPDGNNPILIVYGVAGLIGGVQNLWSNWSKAKNFKTGFGYFASGFAGGAVAVTNPLLGGSITAAGNVALDIATGNVPKFQNGWQVAKYIGGVALDGFGAAGSGSLARVGANKLGIYKFGAGLGGDLTFAGAQLTEGAEWVSQFGGLQAGEVAARNLTTSAAKRLGGF